MDQKGLELRFFSNRNKIPNNKPRLHRSNIIERFEGRDIVYSIHAGVAFMHNNNLDLAISAEASHSSAAKPSPSDSTASEAEDTEAPLSYSSSSELPSESLGA